MKYRQVLTFPPEMCFQVEKQPGIFVTKCDWAGLLDNLDNKTTHWVTHTLTMVHYLIYYTAEGEKCRSNFAAFTPVTELRNKDKIQLKKFCNKLTQYLKCYCHTKLIAITIVIYLL